MVLKVVQSIKDPATALSELASACLRAGNVEDARTLTRAFVVKPRNFLRPVRRLVEEVSMMSC